MFIFATPDMLAGQNIIFNGVNAPFFSIIKNQVLQKKRGQVKTK